MRNKSKNKKYRKHIWIAAAAVILCLGIFLPVYEYTSCNAYYLQNGCVQTRGKNLIGYIANKKSGEYSLYVSLDDPSNTLSKSIKKYPTTIGNYKLVGNENYSVYKCFSLEHNQDSLYLGLKGKVCSNTAKLQYQNSSEGERVSVYLTKITEGKSGYIDLVSDIFRKENLEGYNVGHRYQNSEFVWFPEDQIDMVTTEEFKISVAKDGGEIFEEKDRAEGTNIVTVYFLQKHPPLITLD